MHPRRSLALTAVAAFALAGCSTSYAPAEKGETLMWSSSDDRPAWTVDPPSPKQGENLVFTGQSARHASERMARENARLSAAAKAVSYLGLENRVEAKETTKGEGQAGQRLQEQLSTESLKRMQAEGDLAGFHPDQWYLEQWRLQSGDTMWKAYVRVEMERP